MEPFKTPNQPMYSALEKAPTGIQGLDEILGGGLPRGRVSLVCGGPGCGKTLVSTEFLVHGAELYDEPGVFMAFEETETELAQNVASLGIDLQDLIARQKLLVDYVYIERSEIEETGVFDLEGLFVRLADAIDTIGAKRVVLDTIETLFSGFSDEAILRAELRRLFRWLKERGMTAIITGERGEKTLTRFGLEEYVSDCVILLDNRIRDQVSTRRLRIIKYRGTEHSSDEFPFLIDEEGIWVMPLTSARLEHQAPSDFVLTGIPRLDTMLDGKGFHRGSSILVSGTAGVGKTSIAAYLADAACRRGERSLYFAFEEAPDQLIRNMRSIGLDLGQWVQQDLLRISAVRPSMIGVESHLLAMQKMVQEFDPQVVVIDPATNLITIGTAYEVRSLFVRLIDFLKMRQVTVLFTSLTHGHREETNTETEFSSLVDSWLLLRNMEINGERNRVLYIMKARGIAHSNQLREFCISGEGIDLMDVFASGEGVLTGTSRVAFEAQQRSAALQRQQDFDRLRRSLERRGKQVEHQIAILRAELEAEQEEFRKTLNLEELRQAAELESRDEIAASRHADPWQTHPGDDGSIPNPEE